MTEDWDDSDWDEWMAMTDAQRAAIEANAWRDYDAMVSAMPRDEFYRYRRKKCVEGCLRWRRLIREHGMDFMQERLRHAQRMLLALRIEHQAGVAPITADLQ